MFNKHFAYIFIFKFDVNTFYKEYRKTKVIVRIFRFLKYAQQSTINFRTYHVTVLNVTRQ